MMSTLESLKSLPSKWPTEVLDFIRSLNAQGFVLTLVGGATRDYLLNEKVSKDLDFEWHHDLSYEKTCQFLESTLQKKSIRFEKMSFGSYQFKLKGFELDLSRAREEYYTQSSRAYGHSDFQVSYLEKLDYAKSFKRRDFSCNAIGLEMSQAQDRPIDPYQGYESLRLKKLQVTDPEFFYCDPVRLLRTIRFSEKLDFEIDFDLKRFNLARLTVYYLLYEAFKSPSFTLFIKCLKTVVKNHKIEHETWLTAFWPLTNHKEEQALTNTIELACWSLVRLSRSECEALLMLLSIKTKSYLSLYEFARKDIGKDLAAVKDLVSRSKNTAETVEKAPFKSFLEILKKGKSLKQLSEEERSVFYTYVKASRELYEQQFFNIPRHDEFSKFIQEQSISEQNRWVYQVFFHLKSLS